MKPPKILDNRSNGSVYEELKASIRKGSRLSVISAYFTIYAFSELRRELDKLDSMRFIFTEPTFVKDETELTRQYYIDKNPQRKLSGNEFEIKLRNELNQAHIARECAQWVKEKVEFKSLKRVNPAQQRLIHIATHDEAVVIHGSVDFTTDGLGITHSNRLDMNTCLYDAAYSQSFLKMFDDIWADEILVEDVKQQVLEQMQVIYKENAPDFIYFVTLYNIFSVT